MLVDTILALARTDALRFDEGDPVALDEYVVLALNTWHAQSLLWYPDDMKVIDARSGKEMVIGDVVDYGNGERLKLLDVDEGLFSATAFVEHTHRDYSVHVEVGKPPLVTRRAQIPLHVRWTHHRFFLQHVAFIPS